MSAIDRNRSLVHGQSLVAIIMKLSAISYGFNTQPICD